MVIVADTKKTTPGKVTKPSDKYCSLKVVGKLVKDGTRVQPQVEMGDVIIWSSEKEFEDGKDAIAEGLMTLGYALRGILKEVESAGIPKATEEVPA